MTPQTHTAHEPLLYAKRRPVTSLEHITAGGRLFYLHCDKQENFALVTNTYEIFGGTIYLNALAGWSQSKKLFCKWEARLYSPYKYLTMSLEPTNKAFSTELMMTSRDFVKEKNQTAWVKTQLVDFYVIFLDLMQVPVENQQELPL